jgi:hypothetical protein
MHGTNMGEPIVSVQWLSLTASSRAQADLNNVLSSMMAAWKTAVQPWMANVSGYTNTDGIWITPGGGEIVGSNTNTWVGSITSAAVQDRSACWLINWHLNAYYRGGHPRTYLPGITAAEVTNGSAVNATDAASLAGNLLTYLNAVNALSHGGISAVALGTVSFAHANAWRTPPIFRGYTGVSVSSLLATQRRRIGR